ncbi:hypothetical protein O1611_g404 [Lasiodiplodia mahajangana]|uniref:Uncharacterized protein n=1 Tax=Lasiodiplodia mahajangana TaxID=1108764 RepID=A0ACC2K0H1_9PEZI|nr:hypothetical protein O1611_g404 [Lasiodiplodia mahajangana]
MYRPSRLFCLGLIYAAASQARECKCTPGESCWPSDSDWAAFNATIDGRLLKTKLPASVCYPGADYDSAACESVIAVWNYPPFHSSDPVSNFLPSWANNSCNPIYEDGTSTAGDTLAGSRGCTLGKYPPYSVNATTVEHVQAAVRFAKDRNLRLNVKNTGHNPKSLAFGSLSIWTHNMKSVEYVDSFEPTCTADATTTYQPLSGSQKAFTVGAGIQDGEIYHAAAELNLAVVGGGSSDVGLVGWSTGGGHGWLTSEFGMGADSIIQAEVVLPSGDLVVANECQHSDLFWALRGGGGGTFGVITKLTVKAHPMPRTTTWTFSVTKATDDTSAWWTLLARIHAELPALKAGGFQGYYSITGPPATPGLTFGGRFNIYNKPNGTMESLIKPVLSLLKEASDTATYSSSIAWYATWIEFFDAIDGEDNAAAPGGAATTSRLLPATSLTQNPEYLAEVLALISPEDDPTVGLLNTAISGCLIASTTPVDNALNPAWREATIHLNVAEVWRDSTPYTQTWVTTDLMTNVRGAALRSLAPDTGVYYNEADDFEPEWQKSIWGENYERLKAIKLKYDPGHLQWCRRCVGSESWFELEDGDTGIMLHISNMQSLRAFRNRGGQGMHPKYTASVSMFAPFEKERGIKLSRDSTTIPFRYAAYSVTKLAPHKSKPHQTDFIGMSVHDLGVAAEAASSLGGSGSTHPNPASGVGSSDKDSGPKNALRPLRPSQLSITPHITLSDGVSHFPRASNDNNSDTRKRSSWVTDLELMHHWSTVTCFTLPRGEELAHIWQVECVQLALSEEPFMHQILAISAFHMAYLRPSHRRMYLMLASQHYGDALPGLRTRFTYDVTPESSHSTFAAASLLIIGAFAALAVNDENEGDTSPNLQDMLNVFSLIRGLNEVLETWNHTVVQGRFADLFIDHDPSLPMIFLEAICEKLRNMRETIANDQQTPVISREITRFIDATKHSIHTTRSPELRLMMLWPMKTHPDFLALLEQRDEKAMAILAYYCAIVHEARSYAWYCERWGENVARDIQTPLSSLEAEAIAWPLAYIGLS